ncbi:hypothetical protein EMIHUDRAFT_250609 [Emiliania huxleyi CCMP1516]|uniref:Chromo domain-containing protein n=2 Tax=Emiliania huxleyi TaxID=2903 RepID=A0A0D3HZ68_EMIH1|nr:hypothetical protein EMIHUDRAFT_250609 [Emiliania huxleyi CCMP1516]EOD04303.1 hypothetical protein EMIHUDRAFT_250609 [Emiliania huxleyi CCMP1516]|eukprot:XP_005756732.1 hypothetical protein EMIHUDRAFT_250609 [Emiliania huxleyi CCMP1516]
MREASDSEWELIDVGGETEYWDTRVGGDENYLGEGAFRQSGAVEYEIKWEGYSSDENTWEEAEDVSADLVAEWHRDAAAAARGETCTRVLRSALADALAEEWGEEEALLGDEVPLLSPHGPDLSKQLRHLRRLLREFLAEEAKEGTGVPMQCTPTGQHPTMRWTPGPGGAGVLTEGDFEVLCRMEMVRIGTVAMIRLLVADPSGFSGLEIEDTGYESFEELWMRTRGASSSVTETFEVERICKKLVDTGIKIGMHKHKVGAWSLRKDASEQPAAAGDGEVAARVYRADLRTRDLGAYWMRREALPSVEEHRAAVGSVALAEACEAVATALRELAARMSTPAES